MVKGKVVQQVLHVYLYISHLLNVTPLVRDKGLPCRHALANIETTLTDVV